MRPTVRVTCGQAGLETVAMVEVHEHSPKYRTDQNLSVKGTLTLTPLT